MSLGCLYIGVGGARPRRDTPLFENDKNPAGTENPGGTEGIIIFL